MVYSSSNSGYSIGGLPSNSAVSASPLEASPASADSATAGSSGDAAASGDSAVPFPASAASSAETSAAETELSPAGAAELPQPANAVSIMATASRIASKLFSYVDPPLLFVCRLIIKNATMLHNWQNLNYPINSTTVGRPRDVNVPPENRKHRKHTRLHHDNGFHFYLFFAIMGKTTTGGGFP